MIIDTHCHYNYPPLNEAADFHWKQAQEAGVVASIVVGTRLETSQDAINLSTRHQDLFAAVGIHPRHWDRHSESNQRLNETVVTNETKQLTQLLATTDSKKVVAIGETGLDYFRVATSDPDFNALQAIQEHSLRAHLELAATHNLPVILHVRDEETPETPTENNAYWDTYNIVKDFFSSESALQIILHCISGPQSYLKKMLDLGAYVGVAANVTYPSANAIRELVKYTPIDRLLLETDAPFLPPQSHRGKKCLPHMISETAQAVQELKQTSAASTIATTISLFPQLKSSTLE